MTTTGKVAIAGGSLGGLTAALLLRDLGFDVTVYERSPVELEERGAGIGFLPDSSRYLVERAGIGLDEISTPTQFIRYLDRSGRVVHERTHAYCFSSWNTVYRHLLRLFGSSGYLLSSEVVGRSESSETVQVEFADRPPVECDLLVCATRSAGETYVRRLCRVARDGPRE